MRSAGAELAFDTWSGLHSRLFWTYEGQPPDFARRMLYPGWPTAAWLVQAGSAQLSMIGHSTAAGPGQWLFPPCRPCQQIFSSDVRIISVRFSIMWPSGTALFDHPAPILIEAADYPELELCARELLTTVESKIGKKSTNMRRSLEPLQIYFSVMEAFHKWAVHYVSAMTDQGIDPTVPSEKDSRVTAAMSWLRERPFTRPWREPELARWCGLSVSQLNRLFAAHYGLTPISFYEARRYEAATNALGETETDVKSIAYELGFSSPANFSTWFKKKSGMSPVTYRQQAQIPPDSEPVG